MSGNFKDIGDVRFRGLDIATSLSDDDEFVVAGDPTPKVITRANLRKDVTGLTTKGDLLGYDSGPTRIAKGAQGYFLVSDTDQTPGLGWGRPLSVLDVVKEEGADPTGASDSLTAFQAASDAAAADLNDTFGGPPMLLPPGQYKLSDTFEWGPHPIIGYGPWSTWIRWSGAADGIVIDGSDAGRQPLTGVQFRHVTGDNLPGTWLKKGQWDWNDTLRDVFFGPATDACLETGQIVNFHATFLRFTLYGYGVKVVHDNNGSRSFVIDKFTFDTEGTNGVVPGFINLTAPSGGSASSLNVELSNARIESGSFDWLDDNTGLFVIDGTWSIIPASITLRNITEQISTSQSSTPYLIYKDATTDNNSVPNLEMINCGFSGISTPFGGTYSGFTSPSFPQGVIRHWSTGRYNSGATRINGNQFQDMTIGNAGTTIKQHLSASATLDFSSISAASAVELTITVTGAVVGDTCYANPSTTLEAGLVWNAWVSATNTVRIRVTNITASAIDPASRTWRADVWNHL